LGKESTSLAIMLTIVSCLQSRLTNTPSLEVVPRQKSTVQREVTVI